MSSTTRTRRAQCAVLLVLVGAWTGRPNRAGAGDDDPEDQPVQPIESAVDYAPNGVPDFGQCRAAWSRPGSPGQWTHAGPVAVADALWWLDSIHEPGVVAPPQLSDGHRLVTAYPVFGPGHDDHDPANLGPLIEDLAMRDNTEGVLRRDGTRGTRWEDLRSGTANYVASRVAGTWIVESLDQWDAVWAADQHRRGAALVALLGVWEQKALGFGRVGGHYAAVAGIAGPRLLLADPLADRGDESDGRWVPPDPARHSCRNDPSGHDDAAVLSHDAYMLGDAGLPGGRPVLSGYFTLETQGEAAAFAGQNPADFLSGFEELWEGGHVWMAVDALMAIGPRSTAAPTSTPTPVGTDTPDPATLTATASPSPTSSAQATQWTTVTLFLPYGGARRATE